MGCAVRVRIIPDGPIFQPPLHRLVISDIDLSNYGLPTENSYLMEEALRRELIMAGTQFGPGGVVLVGNVQVVRGGCCPCRRNLVVNVGSFNVALLHSSASIRVDCVNGVAFIYPQDYQRAAQIIVNDLIWQIN